MGTCFEPTGVLNMKAMGTLIAGGLLTCLAVVVAAGPAAAQADAPGAASAEQHEHAWDRGDDGDLDRGGEHGWHHRGWDHGHGGIVAMFHELGLTEAQRTTMKSILEGAKPALHGLHDQLQANSQLLWQTPPDDKSYAQVVAKVSQENGALLTKLISQHSAVYAKCYAQLAPIQKTRLAELQAEHAKWLEKHKEHMKERMHEHMDEHMHDHMDGHGPHGDGAMGGAGPTPD
jgi:Spy/CpxP family protein refolding chaperone